MPNKPQPKPFLRLEEVVERYQISATNWKKMVREGLAPKPLKFGRVNRWSLASLLQWEGNAAQIGDVE